MVGGPERIGGDALLDVDMHPFGGELRVRRRIRVEAEHELVCLATLYQSVACTSPSFRSRLENRAAISNAPGPPASNALTGLNGPCLLFLIS